MWVVCDDSPLGAESPAPRPRERTLSRPSRHTPQILRRSGQRARIRGTAGCEKGGGFFGLRGLALLLPHALWETAGSRPVVLPHTPRARGDGPNLAAPSLLQTSRTRGGSMPGVKRSRGWHSCLAPRPCSSSRPTTRASGEWGVGLGCRTRGGCKARAGCGPGCHPPTPASAARAADASPLPLHHHHAGCTRVTTCGPSSRATPTGRPRSGQQ